MKSPATLLAFASSRTLGFFSSLLIASFAAAADLPVKSGLVLHFDVAQQNQLRTNAALSALYNTANVDRLLDSRGADYIARQPAATARPSFRIGDGAAFLRFDGKDDFLSVTGPQQSVSNLTLFILAAPRENPGGFSAIFGTAQAGQNDYTSGLNLDFGPNPSSQLSVLNVESAGATGFRDFLEPGKNLAAELPFGSFHVFTVRSSVGNKGNELFLDGIRLGERARTDSKISLAEMVLGGRIYSNDPNQSPYAQGFFTGDIAAVLLFDRALTDSERDQVEQFLFSQIPTLNALAGGGSGHALESLTNPPVVQMLVPGFTVEELPVKLRNQNNLRYRHDGKLVALGYDGRVHLLTDSDNDGLEDTAKIFWDQSTLRSTIGMALLPKDDPRGDGVFIASKERISLILDKDRDGVGDEEKIIASGWKPTFHGVDALGIAVDPKDGSVYFSLGCENFANAYLVNASNNQSAFDLASDRGTIQRISPDFSKRETVCTGVRFGCALAFNRHGDLFATDQEGATWLPNGNPLDELLHIQPGRHYGFPPRHPRHLPQVIDEPPVMEYGPQHQSTVGMIFNDSVNGGPVFGPQHWDGDALICGESRGKLYRTKLVKTPHGYVAQDQLIACLGMLTVDSCVSPKGDLLIACHSGPPDWGTGPAGEGKIFKVRFVRKDVPQPVQAWAAGPDEFRIAFDRPLKVEDWAGAKEKVRIEAGKYVAAGDRYETIRPGYQIVRDQMAAPRRWIEVQSLSLSADGRTIVLRVPRQTEAVTYAITLPVPESWRAASRIEQISEMDVALTLNGIQTTLTANGQTFQTVLPHASLPVARELTSQSADHRDFFQRLDEANENTRKIVFTAQVNAGNIFVPATQPGSELDWDMETDAFANRVMTLRQDFSSAKPAEMSHRATAKNPIVPIELALAGNLNLSGSGLLFSLDDKTRPVAINRFLLPWASASPDKSVETTPLVRTDVKGNWLHGRRLFFGAAGCATCHTIRGEGTVFGPDLSNLIHRDRGSVLHDILQPSATINPDQAGSLVKFNDDTDVNGIVRVLNNEKIIVRLPNDVELTRPRGEVLKIEPMKTSLMPEGFGEALSAEQQEDLITFLLTNPLEPARITRLNPGPPPARSRKELAPFITLTNVPPKNLPPLRVLLISDDKDHGLDEHDYPVWIERWSRLLALADDVKVTTCQIFPTREQLQSTDVAVFYSRNSGWKPEAAALLDEFQRRGGGLVYLHWAIEGQKHAPALAERIGLAFSMSKFRHGEMDLEFTNVAHPITRGFSTLKFVDESYWSLRGEPSRVSVLATSLEENQPQPQVWVMQKEKGRVFACIPGHYTWTFDDPLYRILVLRGIAWAGQQSDVNRLIELATVGARLTE